MGSSLQLVCVMIASAVLEMARLTPPDTKGEPVACLRGLDPVALTRGEQRAGTRDLWLVRGRYRYLFASVENREEFQRDPRRYAIQLGGGCGRMGPLSGAGDPDRFWVHDGRIYIFASDSCLANFQAAPQKHIETDDPVAAVSEAERRRGGELVERALAGFGGADKVDAISTLEFKRVRQYESDGATHQHVTLTRVAFPDRFRHDDVWHSGSGSDVVHGKAGVRTDRTGTWPMDEVVRREFVRTMRRHPIVLLSARHDAGFEAAAAGSGTVGDRTVQWLAISLDGATTNLGIDSDTGRVLAVRYRGRAPAAIGTVTRTFSDFRQVDGLMVPFGVALGFDDAAAGAPRTFAEIRVNVEFDNDLFAVPN